jgi:hypothetical protein
MDMKNCGRTNECFGDGNSAHFHRASFATVRSETPQSRRGFARRFLLTALLLWTLVGSGCSRPPQIGQENRRLIGSLRTAIAAQNTDWLDQNAGLVEERHAQGSLADDQYDALKAIIDQARAGNWADALTAATRLSKAQQPTGEDGSTSAAGGVNMHRHGK